MKLKDFLKESASASLVDVIRRAISKAETAGISTYSAHLINALIEDASVSNRIPVEISTKARAAISERITALEKTTTPDEIPGRFAFDLSGLTLPSVELARDWGADKVSPLAFLAAMLSNETIRSSEFVKTQEEMRAASLTLNTLMPLHDQKSVKRFDFTYSTLGFGTDLTAMAKAGFWPECPLVGMERELRRLVMMMSAGSDSVVLVGGPGVGKSAIVNGLAWHLANRTRPLVPKEVDAFTVVYLSTVNVLAGTGGRGQLEERLDQMLQFFRKNPTVIPFFDEIHTLLDTDDPSSRAVATALKPPMVSGQFRCIGATTDKEYSRFIANDEAMNSRFTRLLLPEPDEAETAQIIQGVLGNILTVQARKQNLRVGTKAVQTAVALTGRYQRNECQPRKSIRLLHSAISEKSYALMTASDDPTAELLPDDIARTFSDISGIPLDELEERREDFFTHLRERLAMRVKGQSPVIESIANWLSLGNKGWLDPLRPRGRFLFLGPPGVGKTELALSLAEEVMRDRGSLITRNMGEYKGEGARTRFMGSDPGYVGFGQVSTIYSEVMMRPYSVVVLDEFEKAHHSLSDLLLSVLDGRGADAQGRMVDFSQCIFVMTSNALQELYNSGSSEEELREELLTMGGIWTPPLVDRIDRVVFFQHLTVEVVLEILDGMIEKRRQSAARPLPKTIDEPSARQQILEWATKGEGKASARRLERALLRWLTAAGQ